MSRAMGAAGMGSLAGASAGPAGVLGGAAVGLAGSLIGDAVGAAVRQSFQPGGGSTQPPQGQPTTYGPGGLRERVVSRPREAEASNRQQRLHNQGSGVTA